jgi:hypothetical protein
MNAEELKRLIEKYYSGESTAEEEKTLRDYFTQNDVPDGYEAEKMIFSYYRKTANMVEPSIDFESRILAGIDASENTGVSWKFRKFLLPLLTAAAGILLLAGSYFFFVSRHASGDTFSDPDLAYAETLKILRDVSAQLNYGSQVLEPVGKINEVTKKSFKAINNSTRIVGKSLKNLDYLENAAEISHFPVEKNANK